MLVAILKSWRYRNSLFEFHFPVTKMGQVEIHWMKFIHVISKNAWTTWTLRGFQSTFVHLQQSFTETAKFQMNHSTKMVSCFTCIFTNGAGTRWTGAGCPNPDNVCCPSINRFGFHLGFQLDTGTLLVGLIPDFGKDSQLNVGLSLCATFDIDWIRNPNRMCSSNGHRLTVQNKSQNK